LGNAGTTYNAENKQYREFFHEPDAEVKLEKTVFDYLCASMKRGLAFFFFLLLFTRCEKVVPPPAIQVPDAGRVSNMASSRSAGRSSPGRAIQKATPADAGRQGMRRIKKRKTNPATRTRNLPEFPARSSDSLFLSHLKYLRSNGIEPDLNEPVSRNSLFSPVDNPQYASMITLSRESFLSIDFDNDILDYTDRFYTNGIRIEIIAPALQMNPLSRLMLPYRRSGINYYGISLVQNMYTPSTTKTGGILYGDRPYAAYLYAGIFKITSDPAHAFRQTSELKIGIIGPNSYGEWVQRSFHNTVPTNNEPLGWEYQVQNDLVLNYTVTMEKGILSGKNADFLLSSTGNLGTLYTNLSAGGQVRIGWMNPCFANHGISRRQVLEAAGLRKFQFYFFLKGSGRVVGYDATLQGGLLNRSSAYTLPSGNISRIVAQGSGGMVLSYNGISLEAEQFVLSPEFHHGWWHKWVHIGLIFSL